MGYTHYWRLNADTDQELYTKALNDCRKIVKAVTEKYNLCNGWGEKGSAPVLNKGLVFNGCEVNDQDHETFLLPENASESKGFDFCKTARKPYDDVVVAVLCALKDVLEDNVEVSSDGWSEEERYREYDMMETGLSIAKKVLGRDLELPFKY